jgi:hypothetical protein
MSGKPSRAWPKPDQYLLLSYQPIEQTGIDLVDFPTCKTIAGDWAKSYVDKYGGNTKIGDLTKITDLVCDRARRQYLVSKSDLIDYWRGFAQAINPYPINSPVTFYDSDAEALESDWLTVRSDIEKSWNTARSVEVILRHHFHDRASEPTGEADRSSDADEFGGLGEPARGHSSRT